MLSVTPILLCGGSGTRLWPLSRSGFPKQFLCIASDHSLFQEAAKRLASLNGGGIALNDLLVVSNEDHRFLATEQLREIGLPLGRALLEPYARNTAPAITIAALAACANGNDPVLLVTPADQAIDNTLSFQGAMHAAIQQAATGSVVILGVSPVRPETGYGYIQVADGSNLDEAVPVQRFVEKPDLETAQRYLQQSGYYWNAGMFVLRASVWLKALGRFRPDILEATQQAWDARSDDGVFVRPHKELFEAIPAESIDYAVIEHCPGVFPISMVPLKGGWSDLGAWDAVWNMLRKDAQGNAHVGDVLVASSHGNLVYADSRLVGLVGVENLVVVETPDAVLVAHRDRSQDVKAIVNQLVASGRAEQNLHRKVHRPWGWYDSVDQGGRFKVKRIQVNPKASLSLQKHHHRAEHWVVVSGTAEITCGDKVVLLTENQSTYIPLGVTHRLANPGNIPLEIIEVQSGSYLGEDDIVRLQDDYGRSN